MGISMLFSSSWHSSTEGTNRYAPCSSGHVDLTKRPLPSLPLPTAHRGKTVWGRGALIPINYHWRSFSKGGTFCMTMEIMVSAQCRVSGPCWTLNSPDSIFISQFHRGKSRTISSNNLLCSNVICLQLRRAAHFESKVTQEGEFALKLSDQEREPSPSTLPCNTEAV